MLYIEFKILQTDIYIIIQTHKCVNYGIISTNHCFRDQYDSNKSTKHKKIHTFVPTFCISTSVVMILAAPSTAFLKQNFKETKIGSGFKTSQHISIWKPGLYFLQQLKVIKHVHLFPPFRKTSSLIGEVLNICVIPKISSIINCVHLLLIFHWCQIRNIFIKCILNIECSNLTDVLP